MSLFDLGLADDENDYESTQQEVPEEKPLPVDNKPFVVKKFRDALRKKDCITGKHRQQKITCQRDSNNVFHSRHSHLHSKSRSRQ